MSEWIKLIMAFGAGYACCLITLIVLVQQFTRRGYEITVTRKDG